MRGVYGDLICGDWGLGDPVDNTGLYDIECEMLNENSTLLQTERYLIEMRGALVRVVIVLFDRSSESLGINGNDPAQPTNSQTPTTSS